jgi:hypothetical protein
MLTKFETKSNRVKGLAFHSKRCGRDERAAALFTPVLTGKSMYIVSIAGCLRPD